MKAHCKQNLSSPIPAINFEHNDSHSYTFTRGRNQSHTAAIV